jgi:hypothetical protein
MKSTCDGFCNIIAGRHKKSQKELAKTRLLKLSKTSRIVTAFIGHKTESQMVTIVTVTMRYLGCDYKDIFILISRILHDVKNKKMCCVSARRISIHKTYNKF